MSTKWNIISQPYQGSHQSWPLMPHSMPNRDNYNKPNRRVYFGHQRHMNLNRRKSIGVAGAKVATSTKPPTAVKEIELKSLVEQALASNGEIRALRAALQLKILDIVRGGDKEPIIKHSNGPADETNETIALINQFILEYFEWNGYCYSSEMFTVETNVRAISTSDRHKLVQQLGNHSGMQQPQQQRQPEAQQELPILLQIVAANILKR